MKKYKINYLYSEQREDMQLFKVYQNIHLHMAKEKENVHQ